jgi:hypothetical protein
MVLILPFSGKVEIGELVGAIALKSTKCDRQKHKNFAENLNKLALVKIHLT